MSEGTGAQRRPDATAHPPPLALLRQLVARVSGEAPGPAPCQHRIPVEHYTDREHYALERRQLFERFPLLVAASQQLPDAGDALVHDWLGLPLVTMRDRDGQLGTFLNVCRHRGMRLLQDEGLCHLKSVVCPYHQWAYGLDGRLRNIPRRESFSDLDPADLGLVALPTAERHGLIWVQLDRSRPLDLDAHLAGLGADLDAFRLAEHRFGRQSMHRVSANWKLIHDAFLDGYHVTRLHRKSVGPFFPDSLSASDSIGRHLRSAVARNEIQDAVHLSDEQLDLHEHVTFSYTLFPNAVIVFHPDYPSILRFFPQGPDDTLFVHSMLTTALETPKARDHFERSFALIDENVFRAEDLFVCEGAQRGFATGANDSLLFGGLEEAAARFHGTIEAALRES